MPFRRSDDFTLAIVSPRDRWSADEPIEVTATLSYGGPAPTTIWGAGAGPIAFSVREIGGTREMGALFTGDCVPHEIGPAAPITAPYAKSGAFSPGDDPNEAFYRAFFADPAFRLPAGRWEIEAWTSFVSDDCGPDASKVDMRASLVLIVE